MALETALSLGASIVMVQELFISCREICHSGFNFYWPQRERKEITVMIAVKKDLRNTIMVNHRAHPIHHPYYI